MTVLGTSLPAPVLLAPVGVLSVAHPDAEPAVARAAASLGLPLVASTAASTTLEEIADAGGDAPRWFQLYWSKDRDVVASFLARAAAAGYETLVVTLDTPGMGWRPRDLDRAFLPFLRGEGNQNYLADPVFRRAVGDDDRTRAILHWAATFGDHTLTWDDLPFLRDHWRGPIVLKGIQHPDDARLASEAGVDGVVVSNHGGRQVDGAVASLDALPDVVAAVGDRLTVLFDSGIRTGADVVKALALGAEAVLLGRPYAYGLALGGEAGVRHVLRCLLAELELTMMLSGASRPAELTPDLLVRAGGTMPRSDPLESLSSPRRRPARPRASRDRPDRHSRLAGARPAPRGGPRPPPPRSLRLGSGARRAARLRCGRDPRRPLEAPGHGGDGAAARRARGGLRARGATGCDVPRRARQPDRGPAGPPRRAAVAARPLAGRRRRGRRPRGARRARPDGRARRRDPLRRVARPHGRADPRRGQHRDRRLAPRAGDGVPGARRLPRAGARRPLRLERRRHRPRRVAPRPRARDDARDRVVEDVHDRRDDDERARPPAVAPRRARRRRVGDRQARRGGVDEPRGGRGVRDRSRQRARLLGLGRRPVLGRLGDRALRR